MKKTMGIALIMFELTSCTTSQLTYNAPNDYDYFETEGIHEDLTEEEYYELVAQKYAPNLISKKQINMNNKQKFVHYVMVTFTYSVGVGTIGALLFGLVTAFKNI